MTEAQAQSYAEKFMGDFLQVISGHEELETVLRYYAPECQSQFTPRKVAEVEDSIAATRDRFPVLRDIDIEGVAFNNVRFEAITEGLKVIPGTFDLIVEGQRETPESYFQRIGLLQDGAGSSSLFEEGLVVMKRGGKVFLDLGTCEPDPFRSA